MGHGPWVVWVASFLGSAWVVGHIDVSHICFHLVKYSFTLDLFSFRIKLHVREKVFKLMAHESLVRGLQYKPFSCDAILCDSAILHGTSQETTIQKRAEQVTVCNMII